LLTILLTVSKEIFIVSGSTSKTRSVGSGASTVFATSDYGFSELTISSSGRIISFIDSAGDLMFSKVIRD